MVEEQARTAAGAKRRQQIIAATLDLVARHGVTGITYRIVSAAAGVPLGSMTYYFTTKDDLLLAAFEQFAQESFLRMEKAAEVASDDLVGRLTALVLSEADRHPQDRVLLAEMYVLAYRDPRYADLTREWMRRARAALISAVGPERARAVDAVQEGLTLQRYFLPGDVHEALIRSTLRAIIDTPTTAGKD